MVFGLARLSDHKWIRTPAGAVVEIFRSIPLLLLIFFIFYLLPSLLGGGDYTLIALVAGLTLYNGSVLAEIVRAGIRSVPQGQSEAAYAIGLRKGGVMRLVLLPQAVTAMMPAIVSQFVVLLKDTALGYIIAYVDLLNMGFKIIPAVNFGSLDPRRDRHRDHLRRPQHGAQRPGHLRWRSAAAAVGRPRPGPSSRPGRSSAPAAVPP